MSVPEQPPNAKTSKIAGCFADWWHKSRESIDAFSPWPQERLPPGVGATTGN